MVFSGEIEMKDRYVPYFLSMLRKMENYGQNGMSREVAFFADGDGDFQPKFWHNVDFDIQQPVRDTNGNILYDAG